MALLPELWRRGHRRLAVVTSNLSEAMRWRSTGHGDSVPILAALSETASRGTSASRCADFSKRGMRSPASLHDENRRTQRQGPGRTRPGPCRFRCTVRAGTAASWGLGRVRRHPLPRPQDALAPEEHRCSPTASPSGLQDVGSVIQIPLTWALHCATILPRASSRGCLSDA